MVLIETETSYRLTKVAQEKIEKGTR